MRDSSYDLSSQAGSESFPDRIMSKQIQNSHPTLYIFCTTMLHYNILLTGRESGLVRKVRTRTGGTGGGGFSVSCRGEEPRVSS